MTHRSMCAPDAPLVDDLVDRDRLAEHVRSARSEGRPFVDLPIAEPSPLDLLRRWSHRDDLFYWSARNRREVVVAAGASDVIAAEAISDASSLRQLIEQVEERSRGDVRYYGGFRFDVGAPSSAEWRSFGSLRFVRPRYEVRFRDARSTVRVYVNGTNGHISLNDVLDAPEVDVRFKPTRDLPDRARWFASVETVLRAIRSGHLEKAVLARAAEYRADKDPSPIALFEQLCSGAPNCYHIFAQPGPGAALISATPERLVRRRDNRIVTEAVAGTRPRSLSSEDDARLLAELMGSEKDRREHEVVGRSIVDGLRALTGRLEIEKEPTEMRLSTGRHLKSIIRGQLLDGITTGQVVEAIHPTPAVGGYPLSDAMAIIRDLEPFDRGWYAGGIGWIGEREAELAVAIRSALVWKDNLRVYSGAGIVEGSDPEAEWEEIEQKITGFRTILPL